MGPQRRQGLGRPVQQQSQGSPGRDPLVLADKPFGEWNQFRITMVGEQVTVYLNDKLVVDNALLENFWRQHQPPLARTGRFNCRRTAAKSAGEISFARDSAVEDGISGARFPRLSGRCIREGGKKAPRANYANYWRVERVDVGAGFIVRR